MSPWDAMLARVRGRCSREHVEAVVRAYFDSWISGDVEARAALFAEDASFADPVGAKELRGLEALRGFWAKTAAAPFAMRPEVHRIVVTGDHAMAHFTMSLEAEEGRVATIEIFETFELDEDGKIRRMSPYWDRACVRVASEVDSLSMPKPTLDAFGFVVTDMAKTLAFYRSLGLEFPAGADAEAHVEHTLPSGIRLLFDTVEVIRSFTDYHPPTGGHRMGLAFLCESPEEVDRLYAALVAGGAAGIKEPWDAFWGQRYAQLADPDGNPVDLFAPLSK